MLRPGTALKPWTINVCSNFGGMGDHIARLPALRYVHDTYKHVTMNVYWHDYIVPLVKYCLPETERLKHFTLTEMEQADESLPLIDFNPNRLTSLGLDLTHQAFLILTEKLPASKTDELLPFPPIVKLKEELILPNRYVVLTPGFTSETRAWVAKDVNQVIDWMISRKLVPVLLGKSQANVVGNGHLIQARFDAIDRHKCVDLIDKTDLLESLGIIQRADAIVGVDNGLLYMAGMTMTPRIRGMTTVKPEHRIALGHGPLIDVLPDEDLSCQGCQSNLYFVRHDFRECLYKDLACVYQMTGDKFIKELKGVLQYV